MVRQVVRPLRISKGTPSSSPNKSRPLSEVGSNEHRRNSPSWNQVTKQADSSPTTDTSSFIKDNSPRAFFRGRDPMSPSRNDENTFSTPRDASPGVSPKRRASIERLKQAGRVKTSNIFAMETRDAYDPHNVPIVERPSANRPKSPGLLNNSFTRFDSQRKENNPLSSPSRGHKRTESQTTLPITSPSWETRTNGASAPSSPTKSALSRSSQFGSPLEQDSIHQWSDEDRAPTPRARALHRHNKSVTFHEDPEVNEYENQTPEPSVSATSGSREGSYDSDIHYEDYSFERGSSADQHRDDSFDEDLENADKTPVVLPEAWSRMSPQAARTELVDGDDDVFEGSPVPQRPVLGRSESVTSDSDSRPLPPLPGVMRARRESDALFAAAERASNAARSLPAPPKRASCTKEDIIKMRNGRPSPGHAPPEELIVKNLDTGETKDVRVDESEVGEDSVVAELAEFANSPPKISRESILRNLRNSRYETDEDEFDAEKSISGDSPERPTYEQLARMHPDEAVPSRENSRDASGRYFGGYDDDSEVQIKEEPVDDSQFDMGSVPAVEQTQTLAPAPSGDYDRQSSVLRHDIGDDRSPSRESSVGPDAESTNLDIHSASQPTAEVDDGKESLQDAMQLLTVKDYSLNTKKSLSSSGEFELPTFLSSDGFDFGMNDFLTPPATTSAAPTQNEVITKAPFLQPAAEIKPAYKDLPRPTYDGADYSPEGTPESVVHHSSTEEISGLEDHSEFLEQPEPPQQAVEIPERRATIRTGGQLKARPSATPADMRMMAEQRRLVSAEHPVPPIPSAYSAQMEDTTEAEEDVEATTHSSTSNESKADSGVEAGDEHTTSKGKKMSLNLDIPVDDNDDFESAFDRVIEGQKKGYLMRQNTKLVIASNRNFSGDSNGTAKSNESAQTTSSRTSPSKGVKHGSNSRKPSAEQFLQTEPWNGKARRKSQRQASAQQMNGVAPPLPGQPSALGVVDEDFAAGTSSLEDDVGEGVERGRLFVKVVGVKHLDLPMPKNDRLYFQLTLDNGLHCVTTASLELGKTVPIGQEFELVVLNDLEFQLTLSTKLPPPPKTEAPISRPSSPTKTPKHGKTSSLTRFLASPKKRAAEKERLEREAADAENRRRDEEEARLQQRKRQSAHPSAWDLLHTLVNPADGSFARAYVNLRAHEKQCFGRPLVVDIPCYNEWAIDAESGSSNNTSVRSKRGTTGPVRRPPYIVGHLELQLLYVPRPTSATDEDMPKSLGSAVREMTKAEKVIEVEHEGHLSQQGGDCVHWRRRFFRLTGPKLVAYHEHTQQKRAVINLSKASRLVDDKSTLVSDPKSGHPGSKSGRRKSAFAEEDEGYAYVEEGFRIRFANGETIDFYADSTAEKELWMKALSQVVGKKDGSSSDKKGKWTDLVLRRERAGGGRPSAMSTMSLAEPEAMKSGTEIRDFTKPPPPPKKDGNAMSSPKKATRPTTPPMNPRRGHRERSEVKSMIF
ncbi:unnamed protein product [Zymoseptoria tritici ST99CH_1A5]|uniref:PH domain-containing protein n=1 Tax=Zymoseptoria tritici ST99CH_1A5 TaxID=1276529 RepID=A0A1Y6LER1_ZYMTR|nr:unnamed protein product [Zymoseptoria tritici ST99CH_3D1]SMY22997.1 unnamed protein product [Zymoseptoria tritici ST99CH_1A5]